MYAIIEDGGKQYKVSEGDTLELEKKEDAKGAEITLDRVVFVSTGEDIKIGNPTVAGAKVTAEVLDETKGKKQYIRHFRSRKSSTRRVGHRQKYSKVKIKEIII